MITEVEITENSIATKYAQYCRAEDGTLWLEKLVRDVLLAPSNVRVVKLKGTSWCVDRKHVTLVVVTRTL